MNQLMHVVLQAADPPATVPGGQEALWRAYAETSAPETAFAAWLSLQCAAIEGAVGGVLVLGAPDAGPYAPVCVWPRGQAASPCLAAIAERTLAGRQPEYAAQHPLSAVAAPILVDGHLHGVVAVETSVREEGGLGRQLHLLRLGIGGIEGILRAQQSGDEQRTRERLISTLDMIASVLAEDKFEAAAQALATDLAIRLDCDRVSIGFVHRKNTQVLAVSHSAEFGKRMNLIRAIATAMDEAIDQKSIIVLPPGQTDTLVTRDHTALARLFGSDSVLTVPFAVGETTLGAFCFERPASRPFDTDTIELCQAVVALCCRILEARRTNQRGLAVRIADSARSELSKFIGPRHFGRKLAAAVVLVLAVFFSFASGEHRVGANATLEGLVRRVLVAPYDGYVANASYRAGDVVPAGAVLASLDDRDLKLEYNKWTSQRAQYAKQYQEAVAGHDRAQSNITLSQVQQAEAQMNLLAEQISRTRIVTPFEGVVVSGDLHQSLGSAVRRGQVLFEVAPLNSYRVVLEVDESDITAIVGRQKGSLTLAAIPGESFPLVITHITPITQAREGKSFFRVEALLERGSDRLRPGMEGVAKIETGRAKLIWIWTHKFVDWLRLTAWTWL